MEAIYLWFANLAQEGLLPEIFEHSFMVRGLLAALMIGPILGGMGTMVVAKKLSFFTQTIGNAAMSGVAIGLMIGEPLDQTYGGLYGFCLVVALLMTFLKNRTRFASDTVIGVILAQTLGIGIIMLVLVTKQFNIHQVESVLFGSLITISDLDLLVLLVTSTIAAITGFWIFNRSMLVSFNPVMARARGFSPIISDYIFVVILTMVVVASLKLVGALLVLVLVVVPAAAAQNIAGNLKSFFWISTALSTVSTVFGLILSGFLPVPTGGCIVLVSSLIFYTTLICKPLFGRSGVHQGD